MSATTVNLPMIKTLVLKDWQLFEKHMAAIVLGGVVSMALMGMAEKWSFYLGSLLLIIVLVCAACFSVSNSLIVERRERTLPFVMSLPVSPLDFYLSKIFGNLLTFVVPMLIIGLGTFGVIVFTALPDGLLVLAALLFAYITLAFSVSLSVAMAVESEGVSIFAMITSMVMINPFLMGIGQIPGLSSNFGTENVVWSGPAIAIIAGCLALSALILVLTGWVHCRKKSFF